MSFKTNILVLSIVTLVSGCASIVDRSAKPITITSVPDRTEFTVTDHAGKVVHTGTTPTTINLKTDAGYFKGEKYTIKFQKEGYGAQTVPLNSTINYWYWGNTVFVPVIGHLLVDPLTGAMWSLPESKSVALIPLR